MRSPYEWRGTMADTVPTEQDLDLTSGFRWSEVPPTRERRLAALASPSRA